MISRKQFVQMGLSSAALLGVGAVSPWVAKAQTVNFGAATTGKLSRYCRGDGSDETARIQKCFDEHLFVEVDLPPDGVGYGFRADRGTGGIRVRSGHEVNGRGAAAKFLRVGKWTRNCQGLINENQPTGDSNIKLNNLYIKGFRDKPDVPAIDSDSDSTGLAIRSADPTKWCSNIVLTGVEVHDWPGISIQFSSGDGVHLTDVVSMNPARGGIQYRTSKDMSLLRVLSGNSGDDAIAFNSASQFGHDGPTFGITMDQCESYTRRNPQWGASVKFGGAREAVVTNSTFRYSLNSLVTLSTFPGGYHPRDITVNDCKMLGGAQHSFEIKANEATLISARRNYMHNPAAHCVAATTLDGRAATYDATVTDNTLSKPGLQHHINIQDNIRGMYTKGNKLIYDYTVPPTLKLIEPKPGSSVSSPVKKIEALAKASVTRRNNELTKSDISLFINGSRVSTFDYYSSGTLIKASPRLRKGSNTVKVSFTYVGKTTSKSWTFNVR